MAAFRLFSCTRELLEDQLVELVGEWIKHAQPDAGASPLFGLAHFPYWLLDCDSLEQFLGKYVAVVVPTLVFHKRREDLEAVAAALGKDASSIVRAQVPVVLAYCFPLYYENRDLAREVCNDFLTQYILPKEINALIPRHFGEILQHLLERCSSDSHPLPPWYSRPVIKQILQHFATVLKLTTEKLILKTRNRTNQLLLHLRRRLQRCHRAPEQRRLLDNVQFLIEQLGDSSCNPNVLRDLLALLVHTIQRLCDHDTLKSAYAILKGLCRLSLQHSPQDLGSHLAMLMSVLIPAASSKDRDAAAGEAIDTIELLLVEGAGRLHESIERLSIEFPDLSVFETVRSVLDKAQRKQELKEELRNCQDAIIAALAYGGGTTLSRLASMLELRRAEYAEMLQSVGGRHVAQQMLALLMFLSRPQSNPSVRLSAARCLGEMAAIDPQAIAFEWDDQLSTAGAGAGGVWEFIVTRGDIGKFDEDGRILCLHTLGRFLLDPDVDLVSASVAALRKILRTLSGTIAYKNLDPRSRNVLVSFAPKEGSARANAPICSPPAEAEAAVWRPELWRVNADQHETWIRGVMQQLANFAVKDEVLQHCAEMCSLSLGFAELMFPYLIYDVAKREATSSLARCFSELLSAQSNSSLAAVQLVLLALNHIRRRIMIDMLAQTANANRQKRSKASPHFWSSPIWPQVNLLIVAEAAKRCSAYLTCMQFVELWLERTYGELILPEDDGEWVDGGSGAGLRRAVDLLQDAAAHINEPDAIFGFRTRSFDVFDSLRSYEQEGDWSSNAGAFDMILQGLTPLARRSLSSSVGTHRVADLHRGLLDSFKHLGYNTTCLSYLQSLAPSAPGEIHLLADAYYEMYWRTRRWQLDATEAELLENGSSNGAVAATAAERTEYHLSYAAQKSLHHGTHAALRALGSGEPEEFNATLRLLRISQVDALRNISLESVSTVQPVLSRLHFIAEIEAAWGLKWSGPVSEAGEDRRWQARIRLMDGYDFALIEPLLALRQVVLTETRGEGSPLWRSHMCDAAMRARKARQFHIARIALNALRMQDAAQSPLQPPPIVTSSIVLRDSDSDSEDAGGNEMEADVNNSCNSWRWCWRWEECKILWAQGDQRRATAAAQELLRQMTAIGRSESVALQASVHCTAGEWLATTASENAQTIREQWLEPAIELWKDCSDTDKLAKGYFALARFADTQYENSEAVILSAEWQQSQRLRRQKEDELRKCEKLPDKRKIEGHIRLLQRQTKLYREEAQQLESARATYVDLAVKNYILCLQTSERHDLHAAFRLCAIWFKNCTHEGLCRILEREQRTIPSCKLLPLMHQITSRIASGDGVFVETVRALVTRLCREHPYHALLQVLALQNQNDEKAVAAKLILTHLQSSANKQLASLVHEMRALSAAYIELARLPVEKDGTRVFPLPRNVIEVEKSQFAAVLTAEIPVDPHRSYKNVARLSSFDRKYTIADGISNPKIIVCHGTDGKPYKQLVKAGDDLRQDAVMQQMFRMINAFLRADAATRRRRLQVRTYKVIPLAPRAGIVEWITNTTTFREYLEGGKSSAGAHVRYRPDDMPPHECRRKMKDVKAERRYSEYKDIERRFRPVFHHFFLEKFPRPATWYERRVAYTRSVSSTSIVGYVVGLGDRHFSNILIDERTAELVHIDLGVAFEQGKTLSQPEVVPFRLTRDMVDGMGVAGIEGAFRRCCEETMRVLRHRQEVLLTIVEVLLHDPLYRWTLSPLEALRIQREAAEEDSANVAVHDASNEDTNRDATRALLRLKQKLNGIEHGPALSVEGQVNQLINEARDPQRLSQMYHGWAAWL